MEKGRSVAIMNCDDDEDDRAFIREAFREARLLKSTLWFTCDGLELLEYLKQSDTGNIAAPPRPDIILLDLNMPRMDGRQALRAIKSDPRYRSIPVVVLSTTKDPKEVRDCYQDGANSYITKPNGVDELTGVLKTFESYWFGIVALPEQHCR